jgi:hypothetical protein
LLAVAVISIVCAVTAFATMPKTRLAGAAGMHMHH